MDAHQASDRRQAVMLAGVAGVVLIGAAIFGIVRPWGRYREDLARARSRLIAIGPQVAQTKCGPIEFATAGDGTPVLELHGIFGGFDQGLLVARDLLGDGFRVMAPSRFGYLGTPLPTGASPATQADAHVCLLDHLHIDRVAVVAHSAGSPSAIQLAQRHPKRVAVLVLAGPAAPGPGPVAPPRALTQVLFQSDATVWLLATFFPSILPIGVPQGLELTPDDKAQVSRIVEAMVPATSRRDGFLFDVYVSTPTINSDLPFGEISVPVLVVTAADDPLARADNARRLAAMIPNARLLEVERGGHLLLGQGQVVGHQVERFIREHMPGTIAGSTSPPG